MTERRLVRWALFAVPVLCALQYLVVRKIGEPYPAVIMPSFGGDATADFSLLRPELVFVKAGTEIRRLPAFALLAGHDMSIQATLVNRRLSWRRPLDDETRAWLWEKAVDIEPSADGAFIQWTREYPSSDDRPQCLGELTIR